MKGFVVTSNTSGGGKTTVTLGLMKALCERGYDVQGYKCGPDYIDTAFHSFVTKKDSRNLDLHLIGEDGIKKVFSNGSGDIAVVEGVMGFYDGKGTDTSYSTYHVAKTIGLPSVLVLSPKASVTTLCAEINGIKNFKEDSNIVGVILSNISESYYGLLKQAIEENCDVKVFGYLPRNNDIKLESRHLGLVQMSEIQNIEDKMNLCGKLIEENVDVDAIIESSLKVDKQEIQDSKYDIEYRGLKIGVAHDKAFKFYYKENLELLSKIGEIIYFSPINDKELPKDLDFIYIGGGYPEVFKKELEQNKSFRNSLKEALDSGTKCYAECGGLMYLTKGIQEGDKTYEMVGFFDGYAEMTSRLQNFGYSTVKIQNGLDKIEINCHEFHKSKVKLKEKAVYKMKKNTYNGQTKTWICGYKKKETLAGYAHVHFYGNIDFLKMVLPNSRA